MELECQQYCNYPEVSKSVKCFQSDSELSLSCSTSSSGLPSLNSAVSDPSSLLKLVCYKQESQSLYNYFTSSLQSGESGVSIKVNSELDESDEESECTVSENSSFEQANNFKGRTFQEDKFLLNIQPITDPAGWIKYASDIDPWNDVHYSSPDSDLFGGSVEVLKRCMISECSSKLEQLPDSKEFVLTRLHINKKGLKDISVLSEYRYFQYIDVSWNALKDLEPLGHCNYLMYLNASHNKLTEVLDMRPPWFLTHVNLSCNEIKHIGQSLSKFWSLCHIDLSYNLIERIEGLSNLKYLRYLNLSHNHIKKIENLDCVNLEELNLQFNDITECEPEGLHVLRKTETLNLAHNKLSCLLPFQELYTLKKLDLNNNNLTNLFEIDYLYGLRKLCVLNMTGNNVCSNIGYREFVIWRISTLKSLDSIPVNCSERVAARMLLGPDIFTRTLHLRTKTELWNQLASQEIRSETVPPDQPPAPLIILVGTFANYKEDLAKTLVLRFPDQFYRCKKYTTMPLINNYDPDNLISVSMDEFNIMIKNGEFIFYYKEIGFFFGVGRDEVCKYVMESKIGLIDTILEGAMIIRSSGLHPLLVLCVMKDEESYKDKLKLHFTDMDLWSRFHLTSFENRNPTSGYKTTSCVHEEGTDVCQTCLVKSRSSPVSDNLVNKRVTRTLSDSSSLYTREDDEGYCQSEDCSCQGDDFVWSWSVDSSVMSTISEPDEIYLNMVKGKERFVRNTLEEQQMYIELHNLQPGLFVETVLTDNIESAINKIKNSCCNILRNRKNHNYIANLMEKSEYSKFIEERVEYLMNNFLNVPNKM